MDVEAASVIKPTMAQVIERFLPAYRQRYSLTPEQASACQSILQCQTQALGGYYLACDHCHYEQARYCSCGNRHCPQCKQRASEAWQDKQQGNLLSVPYYHLVFTLPHEFNGWARLHPEVIYRLVFQAVWQTLKGFSQSHKRLRGQLGITTVLHTWGQNLSQHIHLHCLVPGIVLSTNHQHIELAKGEYLYPIKALKKRYRGILVSLCRQAYQNGDLPQIESATAVKMVLDEVMKKTWGIHIKPYLSRPETIVDYLSRYTYRIAISNSRLVAMDKEQVRFRYKDYVDNNQTKIMPLDGVEFLRRFLQHVLPKGFMRIRHYGFLANAVRQKRLNMLRQLLEMYADRKPQTKTTKDKPARLADRSCPKCHQGRMTWLKLIFPKSQERLRCWS